MAEKMFVRYIVCRTPEGIHCLVVDFPGKDDKLELPGTVEFEVSDDFNAYEKDVVEFTRELTLRTKAKARELGIQYVVNLDD